MPNELVVLNDRIAHLEEELCRVQRECDKTRWSRDHLKRALGELAGISDATGRSDEFLIDRLKERLEL